MIKRILIAGITIFSMFISYKALAENIKGEIGVGVNYPGVNIRYGLSDKLIVEAKAQFASGIKVFGPRVYYNFTSTSKVNLYTGVELDYISFKGEKTSGSGMAGEIFIGGECFMTRRLSLGIDFGPAYTEISGSGQSASGTDFIINIGLNYYL